MAEIESLSQLKNHSNIVNLKQAFMEVDGTASLVFEFMEGNSRGYPDEELSGQEKRRTTQEKGNSKLDF
ncbi:unnamed protein product [Prunus armeniaca]